VKKGPSDAFPSPAQEPIGEEEIVDFDGLAKRVIPRKREPGTGRVIKKLNSRFVLRVLK